jgi:hypothetical protein
VPPPNTNPLGTLTSIFLISTFATSLPRRLLVIPENFPTCARLDRCHATTEHKSTRHSDLRLCLVPQLSQRLLPDIPEIFLTRSSIGVMPPPKTNPPDAPTSNPLTPTLAASLPQRLLEFSHARLDRCHAHRHRTQIQSALSPLSLQPQLSQTPLPRHLLKKRENCLCMTQSRHHRNTSPPDTLTSTSVVSDSAASPPRKP